MVSITALTADSIEAFIANHKYVVIHFWAAWNGHDVQQRPIIESPVPDDLVNRIAFA